MAITKNYVNEMIWTVLVLSALLSTTSAIDCNGKSFHCVNSTHFMICVDIGGGVSQAIDNFFIACPPPSVCKGTNHFECEFPAPTTPSTTLSNVISETTLPWEEVVTASSPGNGTKEFSENYMNTERITTAVEYSVTTDAPVDVTAAASWDYYVNNALNATLAAEIANAAVETKQTVHEDLNVTEYVPTVGIDITTTVVETVTQTTVAYKNLTEMEPVVIDDITTTAVETTYEGIIITDTKAAETEHIAQNVTKHTGNRNLTELAPTGVENKTIIVEFVTQTTIESGNLTENEKALLNEIATTTIGTTSDKQTNATEQVTQTTNDIFFQLETVQSNTGPSQVTILPQNVINNALSKEPSRTVEMPISSTSNSTINLDELTIFKTTNAIKAENVEQDILLVQTTASVETVVETTNDSIVDRLADDFTTVPSLEDKFQKSDTVNVSDPSKPLTSQERSVRSNVSIVINKKSAVNEIENKNTPKPTINDPVVPNNSDSSINSMTPHDANETVIYTTINKSLHENDFMTVTNVPTDEKFIIIMKTQNPAETTVFDRIWTEMVANGGRTEQPTTINEESLTMDTTQNVVTENIIIPTSQAVNIEMITTDAVPTTVSNPQPMTMVFEDNMKIETPLPATENIVSSVNNGTSTNDLVTVQAVTMDTFVTEAVDIPTTVSNAQSLAPVVEDNMKTETSLPVTENIVSTENEAVTDIVVTVQAVDIPTTISNAQPVPNDSEDNMMIETILNPTENIVSTVNNEASTSVPSGLLTMQATNMDTITTEAVDIPTTMMIADSSNAQSMAPVFEDDMKTETPLPVTENIVSTENNEASTDIVVRMQAVDIPNTISNAQLMAPVFEDNMKTETPLPITENIVSTVNNGTSTDGLVTLQTVTREWTTDAVDILTTITNAQSMPTSIEDNVKIETMLPATENSVSIVNNKVDTNDFMTTQGLDIDLTTTDAKTEALLPASMNVVSTVNDEAYANEFVTAQPVNVDITEPMYTFTTTSNNLPKTPTLTKDVSLPATENIVFSASNEVSTNGFMTEQPVKVDALNTEALYITTTISHVQPMPPIVESSARTDDPLSVTDNILSLANNGASTNGFKEAQQVNLDILNTETMHIQTTNVPLMASNPDDNEKFEASFPAMKNIVSEINNGHSTHGFMTATPVDLEQITQNAGFETAVQFTTDTYTNVPTTNVIGLSINNEKPMETNHGTITLENGISVPDLTEDSSDTAIQKTEIAFNSSANTAMESEVRNENYQDNNVTTMATNNMNEHHLSDFGLSSNSTTILIEIENTEEALLSNEHNQNEAMPIINTVTVNGKPPLEDVNASVDNITTSQTKTLPISINDNIVKATTVKSTPILGFDSAFDFSNKNVMSQPGESKTKQTANNLQPSTVEHTVQTDNIVWNPLANHVLNNYNPNSESIGISGVTNINTDANDTIAASLNTESASQQTTTISVITGSPIDNTINDREQIIDSITTERSIGVTVTSSSYILATSGYSVNIVKVNSEPQTDYQLNSQSNIPVTIDSTNEKTDKATTGTDITFMATKTSVVDTVNSIKNIYKPTDDSFSSRLGSTDVEIEIILRKSGSNTEVHTDNLEKINADSNQDPSIVSILITSDNKPDVNSSDIKGGNIDFPSVVNSNQFKLPTSTHGFTEATRVEITMDGNKVKEEDNALSNPVMLDILPLPINNIQFSVPTTNTTLTDLRFTSQTENTDIVTESNKSANLKPISVETGMQYSVKAGDNVPIVGAHVFSLQTGDTATVSTNGGATLDSQFSDFAKTVSKNGDSTFNSQTRLVDGADVSLQPSQHVEKLPNKKSSAPNNAYVPDTKPNETSTYTDNPYNVPSPTSSNNVNTEITNNNRQYQKRNSTVVTDLKVKSQNITLNYDKAASNSIRGDYLQSEAAQNNNSSTNITLSHAQKGRSTVRTPNEISHVNNNLNKQVQNDAAQTFACINGIRGRYSDKSDCRKFHICFGNSEPIIGQCPENTVFSELKKLCTRNMSHCIRENQFKCPSVGRFSDIVKENIYYICVNHTSKLYRLKFQCQKGYILDKTSVKCIETNEIESNESVSISSSDNSQTSSSATRSSISSKSISASSTSNSGSSSKSNNSSSKNNNLSKFKKSNEAEEPSEKSGGNEDDEDEEVFKCKKEGKFPIRNECRRYYLCKRKRSEYRRKIKKCDSGKVFHKDKKKCVDDDSYEC